MENAKTKFARRVEIVTNLSIVVVALVGATVLVKNYLLHPLPSSAEPKRALSSSEGRNPQMNSAPRAPTEGAQLSVAGFDWNASAKTVVLALSSKCHFCTESAPFYQRLRDELSQRKNVRLIAVLPQESAEARQYLAELGLQIGDVRQTSLAAIGVSGTPTVIIVDNNGRVERSWVGRLSPDKESEVLSRVKA